MGSGGDHPRREHNQVVSPLDNAAFFGQFQFDNRIMVFVLPNGSHLAAHKLDAHGLGVLVELLVALAEGADVHVVDGDLGHRQRAADEHGLFDGVHAADARAIFDAEGLVTGTGALDVGDGGRFHAVAGAQDAAIGAGGRQEAFHHQRVDDVGQFAAAIFFLCTQVGQFETGRKDNGGRR